MDKNTATSQYISPCDSKACIQHPNLAVDVAPTMHSMSSKKRSANKQSKKILKSKETRGSTITQHPSLNSTFLNAMVMALISLLFLRG